MPPDAGRPARTRIALRGLSPVPVEVRPAPAAAARWRITGSARHPLAEYLNAMPCPPGRPEAELVVLGDSWTRDAAVALLSAATARTPAILGWSGMPPARDATAPAAASARRDATAPAAASARRVVLAHSGAGGGSLLRGLAAERPGLSFHAIEMREPTPAAMRAAVRLLGGAPYTEDDLSVHGDGTVTAVGWRPTMLPAGTPHFGGRLVLVTGGLGGLGARTAAMLAKLGAVPVLADIRSPDEAPQGVRRHLAVLRRLAPAARTVQLDLSDAVLVARRLAGLRPHAIVHCAGRIMGGTGRVLDADEVQSMVSAKVDTLRHVVHAICPDDLRAVVAFGSVTAHGTHPGLYGYALANEILRRETVRLAAGHPMARWCTAEWSLWSGAGMARGVARGAARRMGMVPVPVMTGSLAVARLLGALAAPGGRRFPQSLVIAGERPGAEGSWAGRPEGLPGIDASMVIPPGTDLDEAMLTAARAAAPGARLTSAGGGAAAPGARLLGEAGAEARTPLSANAVVRAVVCGDVVECIVVPADTRTGAPLRSGRYQIRPND
jgi:NAD(P)-dependent dehydrogenase (short-subunit alcohol dehydrogenase family)